MNITSATDSLTSSPPPHHSGFCDPLTQFASHMEGRQCQCTNQERKNLKQMQKSGGHRQQKVCFSICQGKNCNTYWKAFIAHACIFPLWVCKVLSHRTWLVLVFETRYYFCHVVFLVGCDILSVNTIA